MRVIKPAKLKGRKHYNRVLMNLYRPYMMKFPETSFPKLLLKRYGVTETRLITVEQLADLAGYLEGQIK